MYEHPWCGRLRRPRVKHRALGGTNGTPVDTDLVRLQFDATLAECVEVSLLLTLRTQAARSWHRRAVLWMGGSVGLGVLAGFMILRPDTNVLTAAAIAATLGLLAGLLYGPIYRLQVRQRARQLMVESLGGTGPYRCEIELRPGGVWSRQNRTELFLPWEAARAVVEASEGVQIDFGNALVMARNRAFATDQERSRFVQFARQHVPRPAARLGAA